MTFLSIFRKHPIHRTGRIGMMDLVTGTGTQTGTGTTAQVTTVPERLSTKKTMITLMEHFQNC